MPTSASRASEAARGQVARAHGGIVFAGFGGAAQRGLASGDDALHHFGRRVEGGRALGGVQHAQPAAGPRADVEEAAALLEHRRNGIHRSRDSGDFAAHGIRHLAVFGVDDAQHLFGGQRVDPRRCRVGLFGGQEFKHGSTRGKPKTRFRPRTPEG